MARTKYYKRRDDAIEALLSGLSRQEAADAVGIHPATLSRWMQKPGFREALESAKSGAASKPSQPTPPGREMDPEQMEAWDALNEHLGGSKWPHRYDARLYFLAIKAAEKDPMAAGLLERWQNTGHYADWLSSRQRENMMHRPPETR